MQSFRKGFTIIEVLVVIVVIGILAGITVFSFRGIQERAYNTDRLQEMKSYEKLFQTYLAEFKEYPPVNALGGHCLGSDFPKAAEINADMSGVPSTNPITAPFNSGGYCRDLFYAASRHQSNAALNTELAKVGKFTTSPKTLKNSPGAKAIGPYVTYQTYNASPNSGIIISGIFNGKDGDCPAGTDPGYVYPAHDNTIICTIRLPEAPFRVVP